MRPIDADLLGLTDMEIIMCDGDYKEALKMLIDKIEHAPTIEPERKKGRWIDDGTYGDYHPHHAWHCSECEESVIEIDTPWFKFCPNCGADMRGEPDD